MQFFIKRLQAVAKPSSVNAPRSKAPSIKVARDAIKEKLAEGVTLWVLVDSCRVRPSLFAKCGDYNKEFLLALKEGRVFDVAFSTVNSNGRKLIENLPVDLTVTELNNKTPRRYYDHSGTIYSWVRKQENAIL